MLCHLWYTDIKLEAHLFALPASESTGDISEDLSLSAPPATESTDDISVGTNQKIHILWIHRLHDMKMKNDMIRSF